MGSRKQTASLTTPLRDPLVEGGCEDPWPLGQIHA